MRVFGLFLLVPFVAVCAGCGGSGSAGTPVGPTPPTPPPATYPSLTGNWALTANSTVTPLVTQIGAYVTNTNGTVSGIVHPLNSPCYSLAQDVPITGTVTTAGAVSATSSPEGGQVLTLTGNVASGVLSGGTYSIAGGCGAGDKGTVTGYIVPAYTNTYTGTFASVSDISIGAVITTVQSGPDVNGLYSVTGSATFTNSPCFASATISSSEISGAYIEVILAANDGSQVTFDGYITDSTGKTISGDYEVEGGKCSGDHGTGSISVS
jgi:hypothetical protein